jgi:hypothetical protein
MKNVIVGIFAAVLGGILVFYYSDFIHIHVINYFSKSNEYRSYYKDIDKANNKVYSYTSINGSLNLKKGTKSFKTTTIVYDRRNKGQPMSQPGEWDLKGYKSSNKLYFAYNGGIAYFTMNDTNEFIGYWIGETVGGRIVKCPYVVTIDPTRYSEEDAKRKWPILEKDCCEYDIAADECSNIFE